jgi:hypothetical protein
MTEARTAGIPLIQHAPRSRAQQSFQGLADVLMGKDTGQAEPRKERRRLFSFM